MPTESDTTYLGLPYPTSGNNGSNFATGVADLANGIDAVIPAAVSDLSAAGVSSSTAGGESGIAVSGAGAVSFTSLGAGNVYILAAAGALVRNVIPTGTFSNTPTLPASGKYAAVGIDLASTTWGGTASVVLSSKGSDQNTQTLALANLPSVATGHYRLLNVVILNTAGVYSLSGSFDARNHYGVGAWATVTYNSPATAGVAPIQSRLEASGAVVRLSGSVTNNGSSITSGSELFAVVHDPTGGSRNVTVAATDITAGTTSVMLATINTSGQVTLGSSLNTDTWIVFFDGVTFSL